MLALGHQRVPLCDGVSRREWLRVGALGAAGIMLPELLRGRAVARAAERSARSPAGQRSFGRSFDGAFGRAKSCILCFLFGAPAHQDIWDLKPEAPADVRGEFGPIDTSVPGILLGEHVPHVAKTAHRFALIRSVQHPDNTHTVAMHYMLTGRRHARPETNPQNQPGDFPCFWAVMQYLRREGT
ncbi:MAG: DUF1501 domain-containing protein, partial [Planctomycetia bacterium]|nr:DUF1501 domain-containing protein [Planctomycetia bacterium]